MTASPTPFQQRLATIAHHLTVCRPAADQHRHAALAWLCWSLMTDRRDPGEIRAYLRAHVTDDTNPAELLAALEDLLNHPDPTPRMVYLQHRWADLTDDPAVVERICMRAAQYGAVFVHPGDPQWPVGLRDLRDAMPLGLWVRGNLDLLTTGGRGVSIVGARASTSYGNQVAGDFATALAAAGHPVVSGGAFGIDAAAHQGALAAAGPTISVLPSGVDTPYPAAHRDMFEQIASSGQGVLVSEYPCGSHPARARFLARNRIIAALTPASVVVEATPRSGSLHEIGIATELGRRVYAVPGPVTSNASGGTNELLRLGKAKCATSPDTLLDELRLLTDSHQDSVD